MNKPNDGPTPSERRNFIQSNHGKEMTEMNAAANTDILEGTAKITSKGQITVPAKFMKQLGLKEGDQLRFVMSKEGEIRVEPICLLSADELFGMFDQPQDAGSFVLDMNAAREERAAILLGKPEPNNGGD